MKKLFTPLFILIFLYGCSSSRELQNLPGTYKNYTLLPNGWKLTPAGENISIGELPLNMILTKDGDYCITSNSGTSGSTLSVIDLKNKKELNRINIPDTWRGLCFNQDESKVFVSGGFKDLVYVYNFSKGTLSLTDSINFRTDEKEIAITGIIYSPVDDFLLAVSKKSNFFYVYDLSSKAVIKKIKMDSECFDVITDNAGKYAYVSLWGAAGIAKINLSTFNVDKVIRTGAHPCEMLISKNDKWLYVSNANTNSTSLIDLDKDAEVEKIISSLTSDAPYGSTPNSVAFNENESVLFIANADNNFVALFDISEPMEAKSLGFIPVGWYPTVVRFSANKKIIVANGKGLISQANPDGPKPGHHETTNTEYIESLFKGTVSIIDFPVREKLSEYSGQVYNNTPYLEKRNPENQQDVIPLSFDGKGSSRIKHVFYIIKENRTYDQVFGDIDEGNGDSSLCLFNEFITPNQHKLAKEFTLFDNFYVDAEVSADGHNWSTAAYASDYVEKTWPTYYGDRGGTYDYEGGVKIASPLSGYIWDQVIDKKLGFRNYGEFTDEKKVNGEKIYFGAEEKLIPYTCEFYPGWDLKIKDYERYTRWLKDFQNFIKADSLPALNILRLPRNHTAGTGKGFNTINAMVADNDYAVGSVIAALSKSKFWKESIVFILEDDAQNGSDHVDAHRSPVLVISPYVKKHFVDHTMYSTSSVLKTIELILGLHPMTQYDLSANAFTNCITDDPDTSVFESVKPGIDMDEINTASMYGSERSGQMDLSKEDAIPDIEFNEIIWKSIKGENSIMPVPVRAAYVNITED